MAIDSWLGKCVGSVELRTRGPMQSRTSSRLIETSNQTLRHAEAEQHLSIQIYSNRNNRSLELLGPKIITNSK